MITETFEKLIDNLNNLTKDYQIIIEENEPVSDTTVDTEKSLKTIIREAIKPQVDIANSVINSLPTTFMDCISDTKRMSDAQEQIKSFEQQLHGACKQIVDTVESKDENGIDKPESLVNDNHKCCCMAFNKYIKDYTSRDFGVLELAAAINIFYNSLA